MKLSALILAQPAMKLLAETKLPVKASFRVAKALQLASTDLTVYEQERMKLLQKLGVLSDDKSQYVFESAENMQAFQEAITTLQNEEVSVELPTVSVEELGDIELAPGTLFPLLGILVTE